MGRGRRWKARVGRHEKQMLSRTRRFGEKWGPAGVGWEFAQRSSDAAAHALHLGQQRVWPVRGLGKTRGVVTPQMTWRGTAGARRSQAPTPSSRSCIVELGGLEGRALQAPERRISPCVVHGVTQTLGRRLEVDEVAQGTDASSCACGARVAGGRLCRRSTRQGHDAHDGRRSCGLGRLCACAVLLRARVRERERERERVVLPRRTRAPASRVGGLVYTWVILDTPLNTNKALLQINSPPP
jgi:hypothetical protein